MMKAANRHPKNLYKDLAMPYQKKVVGIISDPYHFSETLSTLAYKSHYNKICEKDITSMGYI